MSYDHGSRGENQKLKMLYCWLWTWKRPQVDCILEVRSPNWVSLVKPWCQHGCIPSRRSMREWFSCHLQLLRGYLLSLACGSFLHFQSQQQVVLSLCFLLPLIRVLVIILGPSDNPSSHLKILNLITLAKNLLSYNETYLEVPRI